MFSRKTIRKIHLWIGLSTGLIVSIVGFTGALYVFAPELSAEFFNSKIQYTVGAEKISPYHIVSLLEKKYPSKLISFQNQRRAERYYIAQLAEPMRKIAIDPYTGAELGELNDKSGFWYWVIEIHTNLGLGEIGTYIVGVSSLLLVFFLISSGIYLWWPKSKAALKQRFKIKWNGSFKRKNYDLHNVGGFYMHFFIGILAFTGACFTFQELGPALINAITWTKPAIPPVAGAQETYSDRMPISFATVLKKAETIYPDYHLMHVYYSKDVQDPIVLTKTNHQWISSGKYIRTYTYFNRYTGAIIYQDDPRKSDLGQRLTDYYKRQLHYGEIGGWITRILAACAGFALPLMYVSGIIIWINRTSKKIKSAKPSRLKKPASTH